MYKENKDITLQYYNQNAGSFVSGTVHADLTDTLNRFLSRLEPGAAILDFGCGSGRDTKYFLEHGYQVEAIDGSEELCKIASAYTGIPVRRCIFRIWMSGSSMTVSGRVLRFCIWNKQN